GSRGTGSRGTGRESGGRVTATGFVSRAGPSRGGKAVSPASGRRSVRWTKNTPVPTVATTTSTVANATRTIQRWSCASRCWISCKRASSSPLSLPSPGDLNGVPRGYSGLAMGYLPCDGENNSALPHARQRIRLATAAEGPEGIGRTLPLALGRAAGLAALAVAAG